MSYIATIGVGGIVTISIFSILAVVSVLCYFLVLPSIAWWKAMISGANIPMLLLFKMKSRKSDINLIVNAYIYAVREGIKITPEEIESHMISGGDINAVLNAMVIAREAGLSLNLKVAKAVDLARKDIVYYVKSAVSPIMLETGNITATAKDGVEVIVSGTASFKCNIHRLIGGVDENTLMSRVVEGIITTIGSAKSYDVVIENPDVVSQTVEDMGIDSGSCFEIVSIDITSATIGSNASLKFDMEKANSEISIKKSMNDSKISDLLVKEQENKTKISEMRARLLEAEAEVPRAFANALKEGKLGALDYYEMQNISNNSISRQNISARPIINSNAINSEFNSQRIIRPIQNRIIKRPSDGGDGTDII